MPTGYTSGVSSGEVTKFSDFAIICARASGAAISMRDEPLSKPIPDKIIFDSQYRDDAILKINKTMIFYHVSPECVLESNRKMKLLEDIKHTDQYNENKKLTKQRYTEMLRKVKAWQPPTRDHEAFKAFMISQLEDSIKFDCLDFVSKEDTNLKDTKGRYRINQLVELSQNLEYQQNERSKGFLKTLKDNAWIKSLRESLENIKSQNDLLYEELVGIVTRTNTVKEVNNVRS